MPGRLVSHYELLEPLGRGGMGVVHKAQDIRLGRVAALKFLSEELVGRDDARANFLREARSLSSLNHPHIATVYEVDEADGVPFLAMEYLPGGTLRERIASAHNARTFVDASKLLDWGIDLADGLSHAHARGIVHRDVKSSNAMFDAEGRVKLTDFGLAKATVPGGDPSSTGVVGTVAYMSPEQLSGRPADGRSDLYSLGVVLYELATGRLPFDGSSPVELMNNIVGADPPRIATLRPGVSPGFERIVERLMSKSTAERYQRAGDARDDLKQERSGSFDPTLMTTKTLPAPSRRWGLVVPVLAGLTAIALFAGAYHFRRKPLALPDHKHVLVLPIRSIGGDADQDVLCDGLTETLTTALTQTGLLSVVPATDARKVETVAQAHREFGVNLVLNGSLQRRGDALRLTLGLSDADGERQLGAETIDGPAAEPLQIEEGMLEKVAGLVDVAVPRADTALAAGAAASTPGAFDAYLRGRGFMYRYDKSGNWERALQQFEEAIRFDPRFALAHAGVAEAQLGIYRQRREKASLDAARTAVERALSLNRSLAAAHVTYGAVLTESGQPDAAIAELDRAIESDPRNPAAYRELALAYGKAGKPDRAEDVYKKAIRARPGDWRSYANLASFCYARQRYTEAERLFRKVVELTPDNHLGYRNLGGVLVALGKNEEAEKLLLKGQSLNPTARTASNLGTLYLFEGRYKEAVPVLEKAAELAARDVPTEYHIWGNLGDAYWLAGAPDEKRRAAYGHAIEIGRRVAAGPTPPADLDGVLAEYDAKLGNGKQAVERIESALKAAPESAEVRYRAAVVYAVLNLDDRALKELKEALSRGFTVDQVKRAPELKKLRENSAFPGILTYARASG